MAAPSDVRLVLERHADAEPVEPHAAVECQMEQMLVIAVQEARTLDRLVVADKVLADRDRFHPGDVVLQREQRAQADDQLERAATAPWTSPRC